MTDKVSPEQLGYHHQACFLVGTFIYHFALLESAINDGIGKVLGMDTLEETIATFNMTFRSKTNVLKSIVKLKGGGTDWSKAAVKVIDEIVNLSSDRNTAVHTVFGHDENGNVRFLTVKARDELKFPETVWSPQDFKDRWTQARELRKKIEKIVERIVKGPSLEDLIADWAKQHPLGRGQAPGGSLANLLLGIPDSQQPTNEESPQTPQEPEE